ncbi:MAG: hypothetical protein ACYSOF_01010 [Planctomycetota bacterium]|jgi:hypothetical protein
MLRIKLAIVVVLVLAGTIPAETKVRTVRTRDPKMGEAISKQVPVAPKQADPYENTSVLVEAFVVRVSTEALAEAGVNPIGQSPEGVSILKILSCLDDAERGEVVSGAKLTARNGKEARVKDEKHIYVKSERGNSVSYQAFECGKNFGITARFEDKETPPTISSNNWVGVVTMSAGKPVIAGAAQDDDTVTFLILTATIQDAE